jgi:hypothetical protein
MRRSTRFMAPSPVLLRAATVSSKVWPLPLDRPEDRPHRPWRDGALTRSTAMAPLPTGLGMAMTAVDDMWMPSYESAEM